MYVQPWMEKVVLASLPHIPDTELVRKTLEDCRGNINEAVSRLLDTGMDQDGPLTPPDTPKDLAGLDECELDNSSISQEPPLKRHKAKKGTKNEQAELKSRTSTQERPIKSGIKAGELKSSRTATKARQDILDSLQTTEKPLTRPKRETARDRKERQKREAIERKKTKAHNDKNRSTVGKDTDSGTEGNLSQGMKVLHV